MSTTARRYWLKLLRLAGVKQFRATSALGMPYICHVGDFAGEVPFYSLRHSVAEIALMTSWCRSVQAGVIFDIGANNGYIATQLAQLLSSQKPRIFAFEPVPSTFAELEVSIDRLRLNRSVIPICCGLSDINGITQISYNPRESLFAQVAPSVLNPRVGSCYTLSATITLDEAVASIGLKPSLVKIDVEGFEPRVLRGATNLLSGSEPPALCFEWNPFTASEVNSSISEIPQLLIGYRFYYVDDFEGGRKTAGELISDLTKVDWICNVFALPATVSHKEVEAVFRAAGDKG
jgi:FkbM family methyltransferase